MTVLWILLFIVYLCSYLSRWYSIPLYENRNGLSNQPNRFYIFIVIATLVIVAGFQNSIGDTYVYLSSFEKITFTWENIQIQKDIGFGIYQMIIQQFTKDPQMLIFISALITNVIIVFIFFYYSKMIELSLYVFITGGLQLVSMNGIRQVLAAAICFAAAKYLFEGKFLKYASIIMLASTFLFSALIMIPMYFFVRVKAWTKATFLILLFSVFIVFSFQTFSTLLFAALENTQYSEYSEFDEGGANILRVLVYAAPIIIAYLGRDKLRELTPHSDIIVNMTFLGLIFMIISTQSWIFARVSIYFTLYQLILISWLVDLFTERNRKLVYYGIISCFFIFYYYENVVSLNLIYRSDILSKFF